MNSLQRLCRSVWSWFGRLTERRLRLRRTADLPRRFKRGVVYVIVEDGIEEFLALRCPCGCGETIWLNLLPDERPRWSVSRHPQGMFSVHPSVWRTAGCHSHFFVRSGRIVWCREGGGSGPF